MVLGSSTQYASGDVDLLKDRLGTKNAGYPYGTDISSAGEGDDFATYWKDSSSGFQYAMNRYYSASYGRFLTADPYLNNDRIGLTGSWNRYSYTRGDPVNRLDAEGTCDTSTDDEFNVTICDDPSVDANPSAVEVIPTYRVGTGINLPSIAGFLMNQAAVKAAVANTSARLAKAVANALAALLQPGLCGLFNVGGSGPSPITLLNSIASGIDPSAYFTETFIGPNPSNPNTAVNATTQASAIRFRMAKSRSWATKHNKSWSPSTTTPRPVQHWQRHCERDDGTPELGHVYEAPLRPRLDVFGERQ